MALLSSRRAAAAPNFGESNRIISLVSKAERAKPSGVTKAFAKHASAARRSSGDVRVIRETTTKTKIFSNNETIAEDCQSTASRELLSFCPALSNG